MGMVEAESRNVVLHWADGGSKEPTGRRVSQHTSQQYPQSASQYPHVRPEVGAQDSTRSGVGIALVPAILPSLLRFREPHAICAGARLNSLVRSAGPNSSFRGAIRPPKACCRRGG